MSDMSGSFESGQEYPMCLVFYFCHMFEFYKNAIDKTLKKRYDDFK